MKAHIGSKSVVYERVTSEVERFAFIAGYLFVVFSAVFFFKYAILGSQEAIWAPLGFAAIKAALAAKFILLGRAFHLSEVHATKPLIWQTVQNSGVFLVLVAVLTLIEEIVRGFIDGRTIAQSIANVGGGTPEQFIATAVLLFLIFLPMFALSALSEVTSRSVLFRLFFVDRTRLVVVTGPERQ
jgi:hypothetical protein